MMASETQALQELERRMMTGDPSITPEIGAKVKAKLDAYRRQGVVKPLLATGQSGGGKTAAVPIGESKPYKKNMATYAGLAGATDSFQDDYAGNTITGGLENRAQALLGVGTPGQREWWARFKDIDNQIRNDLFGATLTPSEQAAYADTSIAPSMNPEIIKQNLTNRREILRKALARDTDFLRANGYNSQAIDALAGEYAKDFAPPEAPARLSDDEYRSQLAALIAPGSKATRADIEAFMRANQAAEAKPGEIDRAIAARSAGGSIGVDDPKQVDSIGPAPGSSASAAAIGFGDVITAGGLDELAAGIGAIAPKMGGGQASMWEPGRSFSDAYNLNLQQTEGYKQDLANRRPVATTAGQLGGLVAGEAALVKALPGVAARITSGGKWAQRGKIAATEGAAGAAYGAGSNNTDRAEGAALGAVTAPLASAAGKATLKAASRVMNPAVKPIVKKLHDAGITMTGGQIAGQGGFIGKVVKNFEDRMAGFPVVGDVVNGSRVQGIEQLNRAAIDEALAPIGAKLPNDVNVGHDAIDWAQQVLSQQYEDALKPLQAPIDQQFATGVRNIGQMAGRLPDSQKRTWDGIFREQIQPVWPKNGVFNGKQVQTIKQVLDGEIAAYRRASPENRPLLRTLETARDELMDFAKRASPKEAEAFAKVDDAYANFVRVETAAAKAKGGVFSPEQLRVAVRQSDKTARKRGTAAGKARMQELSDAASQVLPSSVPDSGTPGRLALPLMMGVAGAGGGYAGGGGVEGALYGSALALPYTPVGRRAVQELMLGKRPDFIIRGGKVLERQADNAGRLGLAASFGLTNR